MGNGRDEDDPRRKILMINGKIVGDGAGQRMADNNRAMNAKLFHCGPNQLRLPRRRRGLRPAVAVTVARRSTAKTRKPRAVRRSPSASIMSAWLPLAPCSSSTSARGVPSGSRRATCIRPPSRSTNTPRGGFSASIRRMVHHDQMTSAATRAATTSRTIFKRMIRVGCWVAPFAMTYTRCGHCQFRGRASERTLDDDVQRDRHVVGRAIPSARVFQNLQIPEAVPQGFACPDMI